MLQSRPTRSLIAKFPQRLVVVCSTWISCCRERTLQTRPRTGVCEPLMPGVVVSKLHQNNRSYVSSVDLPSDSLRKNLASWAVNTENLEKPQNCQNWRVGACSGQYSIITKMLLSSIILLQITRRKADEFTEGKSIPQCQVMLEWNGKGETPKRLVFKVVMRGATPPNNYFRLVLDPAER